jgi:hypothetical protein
MASNSTFCFVEAFRAVLLSGAPDSKGKDKQNISKYRYRCPVLFVSKYLFEKQSWNLCSSQFLMDENEIF